MVLEASVSRSGSATTHRCRGRRHGSGNDRPGCRGAVPADRGLPHSRQQGGPAAAGGALACESPRGRVGGREAANPHQDAVHEVRGLPADLRPERRPLVPELHQDRVPVGAAAAARGARAGAGRGGLARRGVRLPPAGALLPAGPAARPAPPGARGRRLALPGPAGGRSHGPAQPAQPDPGLRRPRL